MIKKLRSTLMLRPFRRIGSMLPPGIQSLFENKLKQAGIRLTPRVWLGIRISFSVLFGGLVYFMAMILENPDPTFINLALGLKWWVLGSLLAAITFYLSLYFIISDRASALEKLLPDFLLLTVSNLRAGMTPFKAFVSSARPEFGALHHEVLNSAAQASGDVSLSEALNEMGTHFDSKIFRRTIALFGKGIQSGGQLASLLRSCADEVQHIQDLRAELATTTRSYTLFLGFITVIIMPFLLSVSTLFVEVFIRLQPEMDSSTIQAMGGIPMFSGKIMTTPNEMVLASMITLVITSFLVASLSGIIRKGKAVYGIRYFPVLAGASIVFYFLAHAAIDKMLLNFAG